MKFTSAASIKEKVYADYAKYCEELNSNFFDFEVEGTKGMLLRVYAEIQNRINGDAVVRLHNANVGFNEDLETIVSGLVIDEEFDSFDKEIFTGNYQKFLESFNEKESETGLYRLMDAEYEGEYITGTKLDFVW